MNFELLAIFAPLALVLAIVPAPTMLLALANGASGGMRRASLGIVGASLGIGLLILTAVLGLAPLVLGTPWIEKTLRLCGIAWLVWLGVQLWVSEPGDASTATASRVSAARLQGGGVLGKSLGAALSDPTVLSFFAALLPQFSDTAKPSSLQYLLLGGIVVGMQAGALAVYAAVGAQARRRLAPQGQILLRRMCAGVLWVMAASLAGLFRVLGF